MDPVVEQRKGQGCGPGRRRRPSETSQLTLCDVTGSAGSESGASNPGRPGRDREPPQELEGAARGRNLPGSLLRGPGAQGRAKKQHIHLLGPANRRPRCVSPIQGTGVPGEAGGRAACSPQPTSWVDAQVLKLQNLKIKHREKLCEGLKNTLVVLTPEISLEEIMGRLPIPVPRAEGFRSQVTETKPRSASGSGPNARPRVPAARQRGLQKRASSAHSWCRRAGEQSRGRYRRMWKFRV